MKELSKLEQEVRSLDIIDKPLYEIAIATSHIMGANYGNCKLILTAKRKGFKSATDYEKNLARKRGFKSLVAYRKELAKNNGFDSLAEYHEALAKKRGFNSVKEYNQHLAERAGCNKISELTAKNAGFKSVTDYHEFLALMKEYDSYYERYNPPSKQKIFEDSLKIKPPKRIFQLADKAADEKINPMEREELRQQLVNLFSTLPETDREIILSLHCLNKTMIEIAKQRGISYQAIEQKEQTIMERLRFRAERLGLQEYLK